ncbi:MAG: ABC transporter permease subunit [Gammaproteobacteria bacterium]
MIWMIAKREFKNLFISPIAWILLSVFQIIMAYLFLSQLDQYLYWQPQLAGLQGAPGATDIIAAPLLQTAGFIVLWIVPAITMRTLSEEQRNGTMPLLVSSPVTGTDIILGKFTGILLFFFVLLILLMAMPVSLYAGTAMDTGKLLSGAIGLALLFSAFTAVGIYMSSLTEQPIIAAVSTFGILLFLWIIDWSQGAREDVSGLFHYLSLQTHLDSFIRGLFSTTDLMYYLLIIAVALMLAIRRLDNKRLSG